MDTDLVVGDIADATIVPRVLEDYGVTAVMHFAAYAYVGESVRDPAIYYQNNVAGTIHLLTCMVRAGVKMMVFSSTCATYGLPEAIPITEDHPQRPVTPYGTSKLMVEQSCGILTGLTGSDRSS
jgi:UDP-glucose 4-epimerase